MKEYTEIDSLRQRLDDAHESAEKLRNRIAALESELSDAEKREARIAANRQYLDYVDENSYKIADEAIQLFVRITAPWASFPVIAELARLRNAALNS